MINNFVWGEILLYASIIACVHYFPQWQKLNLPSIFGYALDWYTVMIPLLISLIHAFSTLIFTYSLLPLLFFLTTFVIFLDLYDYIRKVDVFHAKFYFRKITRMVFLCFSLFLVSLIILRIYTYFII